MDAYGAAPAKIVSNSGKVPPRRAFSPLASRALHLERGGPTPGSGRGARPAGVSGWELAADAYVRLIAGVPAPLAAIHGEQQVPAPAPPVRLDSAVQETRQPRMAPPATQRFQGRGSVQCADRG